MLKSIIAAGMIAFSSIASAGIMGNAYCNDRYIGMMIITDEGAQVLGDPSAILHNEYLLQLVLKIDEENDGKLAHIEVCAEPEEDDVQM